MSARARDEYGRFISPQDVEAYEITVWNLINGDIIEKLWRATGRQLSEIEDRYRDEWGIEIQTELL